MSTAKTQTRTPTASPKKTAGAKTPKAPPRAAKAAGAAVAQPRRTFKVLVAKAGLDGHDRGAKIIARCLRDAGFDVVYGGLHQTPEMVVSIALQEDVDVIGLSVLSGAHMVLFRRVLNLLKKKNATNIQVIGGGIMMDDDINALKALGVRELFTPGATTDEIVAFVTRMAQEARV